MYRYEVSGDNLGELESKVCDQRLMPSHNRGLPKYKAFYRLITEPFFGMYNATQSMNQQFSVENAVGKQLDIVGSYVGVSRYLDFVPTNGSRQLSDDDYRLLINAKIASNMWDGTYKGLIDIIEKNFSDFAIVVQDNLNCTLTYVIKPTRTMTALQEEMFTEGIILPKPSGVGVIVNIESNAVDNKNKWKFGHVVSGKQYDTYDYLGDEVTKVFTLDDEETGKLNGDAIIL